MITIYEAFHYFFYKSLLDLTQILEQFSFQCMCVCVSKMGAYSVYVCVGLCICVCVCNMGAYSACPSVCVCVCVSKMGAYNLVLTAQAHFSLRQ